MGPVIMELEVGSDQLLVPESITGALQVLKSYLVTTTKGTARSK